MAIMKNGTIVSVDNRADCKGNRCGCSACALINDKIKGRRRERGGDKKRGRIRGKRRTSPRIPKDFRDDRTEEMNRVPLIPVQGKTSESDAQDLVILEVGPPEDTWRYSVERERFAEKSEWFRAMLVGPLAPPPSNPPPTVTLQHVEKRAFDHLLTYLRGEALNFHSVSTARSTLDVAHQLLCPELARHAIDYITANLSASTVLGVYHGLDLYVRDVTNEAERTPRSPTAPPAPGDDEGEIAIACSRLLSVCHDIIDAAPEEVLRQENFEDLRAREVAVLASRDELRLGREGVLFNALEKWSAAECRRRGLEPTANNKRAVLDDDVWYSVRYLLMTGSEFIEGPMASGILTGAESALIATLILDHDQKPTNQQLQNTVVTSRLSTTPRNRTRSTDSSSLGMKPGKKEREDNKKNRRKECATQSQKACSRIGYCIVRVLACVFE